MCVCVFFLNFVSFFTLRTRLLCRSLQKKSDRTRCPAVSILEYNIKLEFGFSEGRTKCSLVIHR